MNGDLDGNEKALPTVWSWPAPWPAAWPDPPPPALEREDLAVLRQGDLVSDRTEALAAAFSGARGAIDMAIGEGLSAMRRGDRLISLGFSSLGDHAREVLGIGERTAQNLARLAQELQARPLLRAAVRTGEVRIRKAQTVLPVAKGEQEQEWVGRRGKPGGDLHVPPPARHSRRVCARRRNRAERARMEAGRQRVDGALVGMG